MTPRHPDDYYATDPRAIIALLKYMGWENGRLKIYENSCGQGHLSIPMQEAGHTVISTDLIHRGFGIGGIDFLSNTFFHTLKYDAVVMNPPFKHALQFIKRSFTLAPVVCCFLRLAFLEGGDKSGRYSFYQETPPTQILIFSDRVPTAINGDFENTGPGKTAYCWMIWIEGEKPRPPKWVRL